MQIGPYQVEGEVQRSPAVLVYRARDSLGMRVILKLFLLKSDEEKATFEAQATALSQLRHPNLVRVQSVGVHEDHPFMVLDTVAGGSLQERLDLDGPMNLDQAVEAVRVLARALDHAHQSSIYHGDITPSHVLLPPGRGPKLADFGLSRFEAGTWSGEAGGRLVGTLGYMPPEFTLEQPELPSVLSDIFSLGATFYAALSGRPPFTGQTPADVRVATLRASPRPLFGQVPRVDPSLDAICLRCMEKNPDLRYQSAADLAETLDRYLSGDLVKPSWTEGATVGDAPEPDLRHATLALSPNDSRLHRTEVIKRDHQTLELPPEELPLRAGLQGAVTLPLPDSPIPLPAPATGVLAAVPTPGGADTMEMPEPQRIEDPPSAEVVTFELPPWKRRRLGIASKEGDTRRDSTRKGKVEAPSSPSRSRRAPRAIAEPGPGLLITLAGGGVLLTVLAVVLGWQLIGLKRQLRTVVGELDVATGKLGEVTSDEVGLAKTVASLREDLETVQASSAEVKKELQGLRKRRSTRKSGDAERWLRRGNALRGAVLTDGTESAMNAYTKAIEVDPKNALAYFWRGELHYKANKRALAVSDYTRAVQLDPKLARAFLGRARVRYEQNMRRPALEDLERTIELDDTLTDAFYMRGMVKNRMGDLQGARADYTKVIEAQPDNIKAYMNRGYMLKRLGDYKGALKDFSSAVAADPDNLHLYHERGKQRLELGQYKGALADAIKMTNLQSTNALGWWLMGDAKHQLGDLEGALKSWAFVIDFAPNSPAAIEVQKSINSVERILESQRKGR